MLQLPGKGYGDRDIHYSLTEAVKMNTPEKGSMNKSNGLGRA